jgi:hypothetical protein
MNCEILFRGMAEFEERGGKVTAWPNLKREGKKSQQTENSIISVEFI